MGDGDRLLMSHWKLEKLVKEVQPLLTDEQLVRWVDISLWVSVMRKWLDAMKKLICLF